MQHRLSPSGPFIGTTTLETADGVVLTIGTIGEEQNVRRVGTELIGVAPPTVLVGFVSSVNPAQVDAPGGGTTTILEQALLVEAGDLLYLSHGGQCQTAGVTANFPYSVSLNVTEDGGPLTPIPPAVSDQNEDAGIVYTRTAPSVVYTVTTTGTLTLTVNILVQPGDAMVIPISGYRLTALRFAADA